MQKTQSALEFVVLASFMLLVIIGFFSVTSSNILQAKDEGNKKISSDITDFAYREIEIAKSLNDGYTRVFVMPQTVNGVNYSISIIDNRELMVNYLGNEYVKFLPANVSGNISIGLNRIKKINNVVYISNFQPPSECSDGIDNDGDGKVDLTDTGCTDPSDNDETNCGDSVCEGGENCAFCSSDCGACPSPTNLFMKNNIFNVIYFTNDGNVILKGTLQQSSSPQPTSDDEFIVSDNNGNNVAIINLATGNMAIKGVLQENQASLSPPSGDNFVVKDTNGNVISYIDASGNFVIKGALTQNGNP